MRTKLRKRRGSSLNKFGIPAFCLFGLTLIWTVFAGFVGVGWLANAIEQAGLRYVGQPAAWLFFIVGGAIISVLALFLGDHRRIKLQPVRDAEALSEGPNVLYLRPFFVDDIIWFENPYKPLWQTFIIFFGLKPVVIGSEEFVGRVLESYIKVREIGSRSTKVGLGRIPANDQQWKIVTVEAIHKASVVVILPSLMAFDDSEWTFGASMCWEIRQLIDLGKMNRAIAMMPKKLRGWNIPVRKYWEAIRQQTTEYGLILPEYNERGCVIVFERTSPDGPWKPAKIFGQKGYSRKRLAIGLIDALKWQAERHKFELTSR